MLDIVKLAAILIRKMGPLAAKARRRWNREWFCVGCKSLELGPNNRFDVPVRGDSVGLVRIGAQNRFGYPPAPRVGTGEILIQARSETSVVTIGDANGFSNNVSIVAHSSISIGNGCQIGDFVSIFDSDFHEVDPKTRRCGSGPSAPVTICNNVWLGSRVMVLKGVTIGENSVIGAMSVVTKTVPANCIAAGVPAVFRRSIGPANDR